MASDLFEQLQNSATIQNVWNDPQLRAADAGRRGHDQRRADSATQELAEECLLRHGEEVLEVEISHLLLQQALAKQNVVVTQQDLDDEIAHAAKLAGVVDAQGKPDFDKWFKMATEEQGVTKEQYLRDSVWPSAALKKLTGGTIQVTERRPAKELRGQLRRTGPLPGDRAGRHAAGAGSVGQGPAESVDRLLRRPGRGVFDRAAAARRCAAKCRRSAATAASRSSKTSPSSCSRGELSGIIQLGDKFVILKCEGRTEPVEVKPQEVRDILYQDIFEKKLRIAMSDKFDEIRTKARIDNYLAGTSQSPDRVKPEPGRQDGRRLARGSIRPCGPAAGPAAPR